MGCQPCANFLKSYKGWQPYTIKIMIMVVHTLKKSQEKIDFCMLQTGIDVIQNRSA